MSEETKPKKIEADPDAFCSVGALAAPLKKSRTLWSYATEVHSLHDVIRPDYFRSLIDFGLRHGDLVDCAIGDPVEGLHLRLAVDWKQRLGPICVSIVWKHRATPCRHDGSAIEEAA
jgi:hypothetical protein